MGYILGTDEAGYGPNLGPLVIASTLWHVADDPRKVDLYDLLKACITPTPGEKAAEGRKRLLLADSKIVYTQPSGLMQLEQGVLAMLAQTGVSCGTWTGLWNALCPDAPAQFQSQPWHDLYEAQVPLETDASALQAAGEMLGPGLAAASVRLVSVAATAVFPERFNRFAGEHSSKGETLSRLTIAMIADTIAQIQRRDEDEPVLVISDKHGGRSHYSPYLQAHFPDDLIEVHGESRLQSIYCWGPRERRVEVRFQAKSERFLPAALASMNAKYLREISMRAFNAFWIEKLPGLRPTAGYPEDAKRFRGEIAACQKRLGIADSVLWRVK